MDPVTNQLLKGCAYGDEKLVIESLDKIQEINEIKDMLGTSPLMYCLAMGNGGITDQGFDILKRLLAAGSDPNKETVSRESPLRTAALKGDIRGCRELVESGALVNQGNAEGLVAIYFAAKGNQQEVVKYLLPLTDPEHLAPVLNIASLSGHQEIVDMIKSIHPTMDCQLSEETKVGYRRRQRIKDTMIRGLYYITEAFSDYWHGEIYSDPNAPVSFSFFDLMNDLEEHQGHLLNPDLTLCLSYLKLPDKPDSESKLEPDPWEYVMYDRLFGMYKNPDTWSNVADGTSEEAKRMESDPLFLGFKYGVRYDAWDPEFFLYMYQKAKHYLPDKPDDYNEQLFKGLSDIQIQDFIHRIRMKYQAVQDALTGLNELIEKDMCQNLERMGINNEIV